MQKEKQSTGFKQIFVLQLIIIVYTFSPVFGKMASSHPFLSGGYLLFILLDLLVLGVYALLWQQALKRFDLHVAYANRSLAIVWGVVWSALIFGERITIANGVGTVLILLGMALVNSDAES